MQNVEKIIDIIKNTQIALTENDIFNFLKNRKRFPFRYFSNQPSIEVIDSFGKHCKFFLNDGYIDFDKWKKEYDKGLTSVISNILDLNEELRQLEKSLILEFGNDYLISANFYFGNNINSNVSFTRHNHPIHVFIKQLYGTQQWNVWENDNDYKTIDCKKDDVIYLKKGQYHQVIKASKRLTLNINFKSKLNG